MKIAVMQPYIFPYLGYYQLVGSVDNFVFFNDVNYIKKGWINRNQIIQDKTIIKFTIPLSNASQNKFICDITIFNYAKWRVDFEKCIKFCYKKAPYFTPVYKLIEFILYKKNYLSVDDLAQSSVKIISNYLGLNTKFFVSSEINYNRDECESGQQKILNITKNLGASDYINPINGKELYNYNIFLQNSINLNFIKMRPIIYKQFDNNEFIPYMSIIDVLMFNSKEQIALMLKEYDLI